jgi:hypothetical protein
VITDMGNKGQIHKAKLRLDAFKTRPMEAKQEKSEAKRDAPQRKRKS